MKKIAISGAEQTGKTELSNFVGRVYFNPPVRYEKINYNDFNAVDTYLRAQIQKERGLNSFISDSTVIDIYVYMLLENFNKDIDDKRFTQLFHPVFNHARTCYDAVFMLPAGICKDNISLVKQSIQSSILRGLWDDVTVMEKIPAQDIKSPLGDVKIPETYTKKSKCEFIIIPHEYNTVNKRADFIVSKIEGK